MQEIILLVFIAGLSHAAVIPTPKPSTVEVKEPFRGADKIAIHLDIRPQPDDDNDADNDDSGNDDDDNNNDDEYIDGNNQQKVVGPDGLPVSNETIAATSRYLLNGTGETITDLSEAIGLLPPLNREDLDTDDNDDDADGGNNDDKLNYDNGPRLTNYEIFPN